MTGTAGEVPLREEGADYALFASSDEARFLLRCKAEQRSAQLLGEDAQRFAADYQVVRQQQPQWGADQRLAQLWDQGGYSWLARDEE